MFVVCDAEDETLLTPLLTGLAAWTFVRTPPAVGQLPTPDRFYLHFAQGLLRLCQPGASGCALEFAELRRRQSGLTELLKACFGGGHGEGVKVLDAFAGWGMDAWQLASRGACVECWESNAVMCVLLRDSWRRAPQALQGMLTVNQGAAQRRLAVAPVIDVVYLDPMFPAHRTKALPNKRLQYLSGLIAADPHNTVIETDAQLAALIEAAQRSARERVVVKRRRNAALCGTPAWQIKGTSVRYDVYRGQG